MLMLGMKASAFQYHPSVPNLIGFLDAVFGSGLLMPVMRDGEIITWGNSDFLKAIIDLLTLAVVIGNDYIL